VDETLVYASEQLLAGREPDFIVGPFAVYCRPHLSGFIDAVSGLFELAIWSAGSSGYVSGVAAALFPDPSRLRFVWASDRCTLRYHAELQERFYAKNLKKVCRLGYRLEQVLMIDDTPAKLSLNYGNYVPVLPFTGDPLDDELLRILPFITQLSKVSNFRIVEKRYWRRGSTT
jgi:RNA polymerase II subunit A small phosphatase-like protein